MQGKAETRTADFGFSRLGDLLVITDLLILQLQGHSERIDVLTPAPGAIVRVLTVEGATAADIAGPPVRRDAGIVTGDDIVRAEFIFFACTSELTVQTGISRIGLKSPDANLLRKQIQGIHGP